MDDIQIVHVERIGGGMSYKRKIKSIEISSKFTELIPRKIGKIEVRIGLLPSEVPNIEIEEVETKDKAIKAINFIQKHIEDLGYEPKKEFEDENIIVYTDPIHAYIKRIEFKKSNIKAVEISIEKLIKQLSKELEDIEVSNPSELEKASILDYKDRQLKIVEKLLEGK